MEKQYVLFLIFFSPNITKSYQLLRVNSPKVHAICHHLFHWSCANFDERMSIILDQFQCSHMVFTFLQCSPTDIEYSAKFDHLEKRLAACNNLCMCQLQINKKQTKKCFRAINSFDFMCEFSDFNC